MKKKQTLEDFIRTYINNLKLENSGEISRISHVNEGENDARGSFLKASADINNSFVKSGGGYGRYAESLAKRGLNLSGYADYIKKHAERERGEKLESALSSAIGTEYKNLQKYRSYVEKINTEKAKEKENKINKVTAALEGTNILSYDDAYNYALSEGLDENTAEAAAKNAVLQNSRKVRQNIIKIILNKRLSAEETFVYATALGLDEPAAAELAEYAKKINESFNPSNGSYADYIKNLAQH